MEKENIEILVYVLYAWFSLGYAGFMAWMFELYLNKTKMKFRLRLKLFLIMVPFGLGAFLLSFRSIYNYTR